MDILTAVANATKGFDGVVVGLLVSVIVNGEDFEVAGGDDGLGGDNLVHCELWLRAVGLNWEWEGAG